MLFVKQSGFAKMAALLENFRGRKQIAQQFSVDVSGGEEAAETNFAVGHFTITPAQRLLQVGRDMPEISCATAANAPQTEIRRACPERSAGRGDGGVGGTGSEREGERLDP